MDDTAVRLAEAMADEANTIAKYTRDIIAIRQENKENSERVINKLRSIIAEELKHELELTQEYVNKTEIQPEGYEVEKDGDE